MAKYCLNRGCGQKFEEENNGTESCRHHPGVPFFHDAYKGWTCCNKKSVDFTEFLNILGCTLGKHSDVKPDEPVEKGKEKCVVEQPEIVRQPMNSEIKLTRPPFDAPLKIVEAKVSPSYKQQIDDLPTTKINRLAHLVNEVSIGTKCKHSGCEVFYESDETNCSECFYHPGVPIFHEGMKYWSCCQKKTSDFTTFMNQRGCEIGRHLWFKEENLEQIQCRWDWHQTASNVVVSIYAKMVDYKKSFVKVNPIRLNVELVFPQQNDHKFSIDLELRGIINVDKTVVNIMATKVEIVMSKAELGNWPKLLMQKKIDEIKPLEQKAQLAAKAIEVENDSDKDTLDDIEPEKGLKLQ